MEKLSKRQFSYIFIRHTPKEKTAFSVLFEFGKAFLKAIFIYFYKGQFEDEREDKRDRLIKIRAARNNRIKEALELKRRILFTKGLSSFFYLPKSKSKSYLDKKRYVPF